MAVPHGLQKLVQRNGRAEKYEHVHAGDHAKRSFGHTVNPNKVEAAYAAQSDLLEKRA